MVELLPDSEHLAMTRWDNHPRGSSTLSPALKNSVKHREQFPTAVVLA